VSLDDPSGGGSESKDYRNRLFYRLLYTREAFLLILKAWRLLGGKGAWIISRAIGLAYALTHPATIRAIRSNIALLDPAKATYGAACRLLMNQAECFSAYGRLATFPPSEVMSLFGHREGIEHLQRAHEEGRGCVLVTGHLGFFEIGGLVMTRFGFPMTILTFREPSPELTRWRAEFRARWGVKTIVVGEDAFAVVEIVRTLRAGGFVAMLADRPYNPADAIPVEYPHGEIPFSRGPALLSLLAGCPVIPVGITTGKDGLFRVEAGRAITTSWIGNREESIAAATREIAAALLPMFRRDPEQWYHFAPLGIKKPSEQ
jgi:KDO2-lipid IV(A) lauroyltransferase